MPRDLTQHSDTELFAFLAGDDDRSRDAFRLLYERLAPRVYKYCRRVLGNDVLAEDVFQETFLKFYQSARTERMMTNVPAYILRIARNLSLNVRRSKHYGLSSIDDIEELAVTSQGYENRQLMEVVTAAIETLPLDLREVFVLRDYDGMSYAEIAAILDISVATVKIRIYRARQSIRKTVAPWLADPTL
jgi:RNA polymerase sigma-70 factor (ECF subfamily)